MSKFVTKFRNLYYLMFNPRIKIGKKSKIALSATLANKKSSINIGKNAIIRKGVIVNCYGGEIDIGDNVTINEYSIIYGQGNVIIGNSVLIAANVTIVAENHAFRDINRTIRDQGVVKKGVIICDDVWIGAGTKVLDGVHIAQGCVIGAGSVVTKSTVPYGVYAGVPARRISERC